MMWLAVLLTPLMSSATLSVIKPNNEGALYLLKQDAYHGYQKLLEATAEDSFEPKVRLNLGLAYMMNKENQKALAEFHMAEQLSGDDSETKFKARFNQGVVLAAENDIPRALQAYQAALEIKPDSQEVKTNIELLWQPQEGGGKGKNKDDKDKKDKKDGDGGQNQDQQNQDQSENKPDEKEKDKPKPFDSKDMNEETMRKVLEELKNQEQRVRAEHYSKGAKERPRDKDW